MPFYNHLRVVAELTFYTHLRVVAELTGVLKPRKMHYPSWQNFNSPGTETMKMNCSLSFHAPGTLSFVWSNPLQTNDDLHLWSTMFTIDNSPLLICSEAHIKFRVSGLIMIEHQAGIDLRRTSFRSILY